MSASIERIWYEDPGGLFSSDRVAHFIPERDTPYAVQLNALLRLSLYVAALLLLFRHPTAAVYLPLGTAALTYAMYSSDVSRRIAEERSRDVLHEGMTREGDVCTIPTRSNPFMNVTMNEYTESPSRAPACRIDTEGTSEKAESNFDTNLFRDVDDVYGRRSSSRPFYTMPNTAIPNDQGGFARWCYETGPSCKEGNGPRCFANVSTTIPPF